MSVEISAIVCTLRRPDYLRRAVASLVAQDLEPERCEIIVVDNDGSGRSAAAVVDSFGSRSNLSYLCEPALGLARARNMGWRHAQGRYVAYLDDDAVAATDWLRRMLDAFARHHPAPAVVGGRVDPIWEAPKPGWVADGMLTYLTLVDWSATEIRLGPGQFIAGTNMALRRDLLEWLGGFPETLGRKGERLLSGEETLVHDALADQGHDLIYDPMVRVSHHVPAARLWRTWFVRRVFWQGVTEGVQFLHNQRPTTSVRVRRAGRELAQVLKSSRALIRLAARNPQPALFASQCASITRLGRVVALAGFGRAIQG